MNNLLVMKFGGTSMGSAERIRVAAAICTEQKLQRPVLAVVSAMSGVTDLLLGALRHAEADDEAGIESSIQSLSDRHEKTCHELLREPDRCERALAGDSRAHRRFSPHRSRHADAGRPSAALGG